MILSGSLLLALLSKCGAGVPVDTLASVVGVESSANPYVIADVTDSKSYSFSNVNDAILKAKEFYNDGKSFSVGLMQVNSKNFSSYGLTPESAFNYCGNITTGAKILSDCYSRTSAESDPKVRLKQSLSCYYSGNFQRGLIAKGDEKISYVSNVINHATSNQVPSISILKGEAAATVPNGADKHDSSFFVEDPSKSISGLSNDDVVSDFINPVKREDETQGRGEVESKKGKADKKAGSWDIFKDY